MKAINEFNNDSLNEAFLSNINRSYYDYLLAASENEFGIELSNVGLIEFFKFFKLATQFPNAYIQISASIDKIWHAAILETKFYRALNESLNPGFFLDHTTLEGKTEFNSEDYQIAFDFAVNYTRMFGHFTENTVKLWPQAAAICKKHSLNSDELNELIEKALKPYQKAE